MYCLRKDLVQALVDKLMMPKLWRAMKQYLSGKINLFCRNQFSESSQACPVIMIEDPAALREGPGRGAGGEGACPDI